MEEVLKTVNTDIIVAHTNYLYYERTIIPGSAHKLEHGSGAGSAHKHGHGSGAGANF
jgi:hypothetical protein